MLSTRAFISSDAASKYYSHSDYYDNEGKGYWLGEGAKDLNLSGEFEVKDNSVFKNLLQGILPNGKILGRKTKGRAEHVPGVDLTFSVPKSFSIQMLVFAKEQEKKKMEYAFKKAVNSTLSYIEKSGYALTRKGKNGVIKETVNKLTFANFLHTTNRNLEPQAHIHCFLANTAKCADGKYRSLVFDNILKNNKFFGQVFRNDLAIETKKLGFRITPTTLSDGSSSFELSHIDGKLIRGFSTRRQEIEELCKLYDVKTKEGRDKIVINSRKAKQQASQDELKYAWQALAKKLKKEIELEEKTADKLNIESNSYSRVNKPNIGSNENEVQEKERVRVGDLERELNLRDLAVLCVEDTTYRQSVVTKEDLLKRGLKFAIGNYGIREIEREYEKLRAEGIIIGNNKDGYTSKSLISQEKQIHKYAKKAIDSVKAIIQDKYYNAHLEKFSQRQLAKGNKYQLNKQQERVLRHILTSKDKIVTIEGLPGVGKSTVLDAVRDIASNQSISILGFNTGIKAINKYQFLGTAPTASAAKTLKESANLEESNTIHRFLGQYLGYLEGRGTKSSLGFQRKAFKKVIMFVDECSLIPTHIMHKLLKLQDMFGFRLVLVGDTKQISSVEAGNPFAQIVKIVKPAIMSIILRQKEVKDREAVVAASQGDINKTFAIHQSKMQEITMLPAMANVASEIYMKKNTNKKDQTLLVAPTRELRDMINKDIIEKLEKNNYLQGEKLEFESLRQRDMTIADYQYAPSFKEGVDILRFHRAYKSLKICKDEYLMVKKTSHISNSLLLTKENGQEVMFNLKKEVDYRSKFEVFNRSNVKLQQGLKIIFTKNNNEVNLINSETATIKAINEKTVVLQFGNKITREISLNQLKHIDYGYCVTVHVSQGKTFDAMIAAINKNALLNNQQLWLVILSRHRVELNILAEDLKQLKTYLVHNEGKEMSALELLAKIDLKGYLQMIENDNVNKNELQANKMIDITT